MNNSLEPTAGGPEDTIERIEIGMADMKISTAPGLMITRGLGSCLGVVLYDTVQKIGGLGHPMLPLISEGRVKNNPYKFVDSLIEAMIGEFDKRGCKPYRLNAKLFGGGHMFTTIPSGSVFNIGARNIETARSILNNHRIKILVDDTGGNYGRTLQFDLNTGKVIVKTLFHGEREM